jgi:hypothetical protein
MYFVPFALLVTWLDSGFVAARGLDAHVVDLGRLLREESPAGDAWQRDWRRAAGGRVYWFVYLRPRPRA